MTIIVQRPSSVNDTLKYGILKAAECIYNVQFGQPPGYGIGLWLNSWEDFFLKICTRVREESKGLVSPLLRPFLQWSLPEFTQSSPQYIISP
jgi:hypothetical protein